MKTKFVLPVVLVLGAVAIYFGTRKTQVDCSKNPPCCVFAELEHYSNVQDKVKWLRDNEKSLLLCDPAYDDCRISAHFIRDTSIVEKMLGRRWQNNEPSFTSIALSEILKISPKAGCHYQNYAAFKKGDNGITVEASTEYDEADGVTCYSIPLFYAIKAKYGLKLEDKIEFTESTVDNHNLILFRLPIPGQSGKYTYYDISHEPQVVEGKPIVDPI